MSLLLRRRELVGKKESIDYSKKYLTLTALESTTISITGSTNCNIATLYYSTDEGVTWNSISPSNTTVNLATLSTDSNLLLKGTPRSSWQNKVWVNIHINSTGRFNANGNIMSLIYGDDFINKNSLINYPYAFQGVFLNSSNLVEAKNLKLPATTLASDCYQNMFSGCTALVNAPKLPATNLTGCSYCYQYMFQNCTALVNAPALPATTLVSNCYRYMFQGCTNLNYIKAMFTTTPSATYTSSWVSGVAASGVFVKNSAATWSVSGVNGVPNNWTIQTASS